MISISVIFTYVYILGNEMCQHLEDVDNPVNQSFPNDQYIVTESQETDLYFVIDQ